MLISGERIYTCETARGFQDRKFYGLKQTFVLDWSVLVPCSIKNSHLSC